MPFDGQASDYQSTPRQPAQVDAWTTFAELNADQRARFGGYVQAKDEARAEMQAERGAQDRAHAAMAATGGDKQAALALLLGGA